MLLAKQLGKVLQDILQIQLVSSLSMSSTLV